MQGRQPTLLQSCLTGRHWTRERAVEEFEVLARRLGERATLSLRHLDRLLAGRVGRPNPSTCLVLERLFDVPVEFLLAPVGAVDATGPVGPVGAGGVVRPAGVQGLACLEGAPSRPGLGVVVRSGRQPRFTVDGSEPVMVDRVVRGGGPAVLPAPGPGRFGPVVSLGADIATLVSASWKQTEQHRDAHGVLGVVTMASERAERFAAWVGTTSTDPATLASLREEITGLARDFLYAPPLPVFADLVSVRDAVFDLLEGGRQRPADARELYFLVGVASAMLVPASGNLGVRTAARVHARTAWICAEQAGHPALHAWITGARALNAEWQGRPAEAARLAAEGRARLAGGAGRSSALVRLACIEGRNRARVGQVLESRHAVRDAERLREALPSDAAGRDDLDQLGGLFSFRPLDQQFYAGGTAVHAGESDTAERESLAVVNSGDPERSHFQEGTARVDVALARLDGDDLDGAADVLGSLLALPPALRLQPFTVALGEVHRELSGVRYRSAPVGRELLEAVEAFRLPAVAQELGGG